MSDLPDLEALRRNDSAAWDQFFECLYPVALSAAESKLRSILPQEVEDVAVEALERLIPKVEGLQVAADLPPLAASISHCLAIDRLRRHFSKKAGGGNVGSLDDKEDDIFDEPAGVNDPSAEVGHKELAQLIRALMDNLKPQVKKLLTDFFLRGKKYDELSVDHGLAKNSVGVYLKRGIDAIRSELAQKPKLAGELRSLLAAPARALGLLLALV